MNGIASPKKHHIHTLILFLLVISIIQKIDPQPLWGQQSVRGLNIVGLQDGATKQIELYQQSYALIIGVSNYSNGWPVLNGVKKDVETLMVALEKHGFNITLVENPDAYQLSMAYQDFINRYGLDLKNRLLFYYAGHGYTLKQSYGEEMGYIIPTDAPLPDKKNVSGFMARAMDMQQIEVFAKRIQSKHALFVFDSCFAGSIFSISRSVPASISYKIAEPVRQFITSGSADEEVPDQSIFLKLFILGLAGEGDINRDGYITGTELGLYLQENVVNFTRGAQHPQFGKIRHPALSKGDFVFFGDDTKAGNDEQGGVEQMKDEEWERKIPKREQPEKKKKAIIPLPSF